MIRNYFLINLLLITVISFLGIELYKVLDHYVEIPSIADMEVHKKKKVEEERRTNKKININSFNVISKKDLFRPSRTALLVKSEKEEKSLPKNTPKLFGTIILNEFKTAILEDPDTRTTKNYGINDSIAGFTVSEILENKVILLFNDEKVEVKLRDNKGIKTKSRRSSRTRTSTRNVKRSKPKRVPRKTPTRRRKPATPHQNTSPADLDRILEDLENIN